MSTNDLRTGKERWMCSSLTSDKYGLEPFETCMDKGCVVCGFEDVIRIHHIIPLSKEGDHCEENVVILCANHHYMIHRVGDRNRIKLPKEGKKRINTTQEIKTIEERDKALVEGMRIIQTLSSDKSKSKEEVEKLARTLGKLYKKYGFDHIDCISHIMGIKRVTFIKTYIAHW